MVLYDMFLLFIFTFKVKYYIYNRFVLLIQIKENNLKIFKKFDWKINTFIALLSELIIEIPGFFVWYNKRRPFSFKSFNERRSNQLLNIFLLLNEQEKKLCTKNVFFSNCFQLKLFLVLILNRLCFRTFNKPYNRMCFIR